MAWRYVGGTSGTGTSTGYTVSLNGTLTGGIATSPAAGDLIVVISAFGTNNVNSAPAVSGNNNGAYTGVGTAIHANDTWDTEVQPFWKVMGVTPDTSLTITRVTNTAYGGSTVVHVWRGVDSGNPYIGTTQTSGTNGCVINPPAYNPAVTGALIIAGGAGTMAATSNPYTAFTGMANFVTIKGDGSTSDTASAMASFLYAGVSYDPPAVSGGTTSTSSSWGGYTFAFRAAPDPSINAESTSFTVTGQANGFSRSYSFNAESGSFTLSGQDAELIFTPGITNYEIDAEATSYTLTGQAATLTGTRSINAEAGSYSHTGQAATLASGRYLNLQSTSYSASGQDATLTRSYSFNVEAGSFNENGQDATLSRSRSFDASSGTYSVAGQDAGFTQTYALNAQSGSYAVTGQAATLTQAIASQDLNAEPRLIVLTGQAANFLRGLSLNAEPDSYAVTGQDATLASDRVLDAGYGSFDIIGQNVAVIDQRVLIAWPANHGSYWQTDNYVDPDYVDPNYVSSGYASEGYVQPISYTDARYFQPGYVKPNYGDKTGAALTATRALALDASSIVITGQPATFELGWYEAGIIMLADAGIFGITGVSNRFALEVTMQTGPTPEQIAAAVLAAMNAAPPATNVKQVNDIPLTGTGVPDTDPWRPAA